MLGHPALPALQVALLVVLVPGTAGRLLLGYPLRTLFVAGLVGPLFLPLGMRAPLIFRWFLVPPVGVIALFLVRDAVGRVALAPLVAFGFLRVELSERAQRVAWVRDAGRRHLALAIRAGLMRCRQLERGAARLDFDWRELGFLVCHTSLQVHISSWREV